jgi:hypothetical protein
MTIKPIPTMYQDVEFRSRLEARWAVFFDAMGITWSYEREGFDLDGDWYLPDFWIDHRDFARYSEGTPNNAGMWLEVKPNMPTDKEMELCEKLAKHTKHCVYLVGGEPKRSGFWGMKWHPNGCTKLVMKWSEGASNEVLAYLSTNAAALKTNGLYDFGFEPAFRLALSAKFKKERANGVD